MDYIEDESGAKFPLNHTFEGVSNFVFSAGVMFEDLQALCLALSSKLESAEALLANGEPLSDLPMFQTNAGG